MFGSIAQLCQVECVASCCALQDPPSCPLGWQMRARWNECAHKSRSPLVEQHRPVGERTVGASEGARMSGSKRRRCSPSIVFPSPPSSPPRHPASPRQARSSPCHATLPPSSDPPPKVGATLLSLHQHIHHVRSPPPLVGPQRRPAVEGAVPPFEHAQGQPPPAAEARRLGHCRGG